MGERLNYPIAKVLFMAIFRSPGWRINEISNLKRQNTNKLQFLSLIREPPALTGASAQTRWSLVA